MSIEIQCMTEKLIVITIKLDYSKAPSKSTMPTYAYNSCQCMIAYFNLPLKVIIKYSLFINRKGFMKKRSYLYDFIFEKK